MGLTRLVTLRSMASRRLRSLLTLFGIVIGVAGILSINATNRNAFNSITELFEGTSGRVSLEVRSAANVGGIPGDLLDEVLAAEGVTAAVPVLRLPAALTDEMPAQMDLNFFGTGAGGLLLHGINPEADPGIRSYTITEGRFLDPGAEGREVVLVEDFARENELEVGQEVRVLTAFGLVDLELVGLVAKEGAGLANLGKFGVLELSVAQELAKREGEIDQVDVVVDNEGGDPARLAEIRDALSEDLGSAYAVVYPASQGDRMIQMLSGYQIGLNFMAGIALFVGAFLIYNAFSMTVIERTREIGLLRSVGMTIRQVTGQVLAEGLVLGLLGAVLGAGFGLLLTRGLVALMSQVLGQPLDPGAIPLDVLVASMAVGVVATLLASALPARQAGRISPLEALRIRAGTGDGFLMRWGWIAGLALLALSAGILVWNPFPYDVQFRLGSLTVFALFLGAMLVIPVTLRAWQFLCRWPFRLLFRSLGEIGTRNLERARKRTMLTAAALLVGVSMIVVTQGMVGSFTADLYAWMDAYIGGDIFVGAAVPLARDLEAKLEALEGVETVTPIRYVDVDWLPATDPSDPEAEPTAERISFMAVDPVTYPTVARFVFVEPEGRDDEVLADLESGETLFISSVLSERTGLGPGDTMTLKTKKGDQAFAIAAVVLDFFNQGLVVTGSWSDLEAFFDVKDAGTFLVSVEAGADVAAAIGRIEDGFKDEYQLVVESNDALRQRAEGLMNQAFSLFDVLGILAVLVAALGVLNTLSMSVVERTREIGMLRSMGMTRFQVVQMVLAEAGLLGIIGGLLGLGFGLVLTRIFLASMGAMSGYDLDFILPVRAMWMSLVVALATSQLAALIPALKAARTPVLAAIHYE